MKNHEITEPEAQKFELYEKQGGETLFDIAYEYVRPGASKEGVSRCMQNIRSHNESPELQDKIKIPIPCDTTEDKIDVNRTARELADIFKKATPFKAATELSERLTKLVDSLDTDDRQYNKVIVQLHANLQNVSSSANVEASGWNNKTHTWNKVAIYGDGYPVTPPVRIVQPGNTIDSIASERIRQLGKGAVRKEDFIQETLEINGLKDPTEIQIGAALRLPY